MCGRYLIVLYYQQNKLQKSMDNLAKRKEIDDMKAKFGLDTKAEGADADAAANEK